MFVDYTTDLYKLIFRDYLRSTKKYYLQEFHLINTIIPCAGKRFIIIILEVHIFTLYPHGVRKSMESLMCRI